MDTETKPIIKSNETVSEPHDNPDAVPAVAAIIEQIRVVRRKSYPLVLLLAGLCMATFAMPLLLSQIPYRNFAWISFITLGYLFVWGSFFGVCFSTRYKILELQKQFAGTEDVRYIGHVINAMGNDLERPDLALVNTLAHLLYKLQASDACLLSAANRIILNDFLRLEGTRLPSKDKYRLILAILKALEQIGDDTAIPHVQRLTKFPSPKPIRAVAQECLPYLYQRASEQRIAQGLLRPSENTTTPDVLLRPAKTDDSAPEQLLRATQDNNRSVRCLPPQDQ